VSRQDLLIEIGTEELPPKALAGLIDAFADGIRRALSEARLEHGEILRYGTPRRLAVVVEKLERQQPDRTVTLKGPPLSVAFDDAGDPLPPAAAFAKKCGVDVADLGREETPKGTWLSHESVERGRPAAELVPELIETVLKALPVPRPMRWGAGDVEFVRPIHWIVLLHGSDVVDAEILGIRASNVTRGHRFQGKATLELRRPDEYADRLEREGFVVVDSAERRARVKAGVEALAAAADAAVVDGEALYDEVAALVEWPVPMLGRFEAEFLELPREAVVSTLTSHQRYFPLADAAGALKPEFITVANIESRDPDVVRDGNERVIRPRLADAAFFWQQDRARPLAERVDDLANVIYQRGLGSLHDKSARTATIARSIAANLGLGHDAERAAMLAKCDLLTGMVGEFPELQGTMGAYYAAADGEPDAVAAAIGEHYQPRYAGDAVPGSDAGRVLALADKLDTLAGIFAIGKRPSGNRDPFGLRRAALGVVRILVECDYDLDLKASLETAVAEQPGDADPSLAGALYEFITERLRGYSMDHDTSLATETFDAVLAREPVSLVDFRQRLAAVQSFTGLDDAESLAAANKRIANILRQAGAAGAADVDREMLEAGAEQSLYEALEAAREAVRPLLEARHYTDALSRLATLRQPVDRYFDDVLVMVDDEALRANRIALLGAVRNLFLRIADISRLSLG